MIPRRGTAALLALAAVWFFRFEYLPPFERVHVGLDMEGYHWPLLVAALDRLREGRFPLWDPSIYCGIPFAGNIQAALFYPPSWLLFLVNWRSRHLLYSTLQAWVFLHQWAALLLCWLWLRRRGMRPAAAALGSSVFAFGGYMVSQSNHVGVVTGWTWTPLAWMGIDEAIERRSGRPLWKTVVASSLCILAGYPATFVAFAFASLIYAGVRSWRAGLQTAAALFASLAVAAVQLLPSLEASGMKTFDPKYANGVRDPIFFAHFAVPDWVGFRFGDPYWYVYLGAPALLGLLALVRRPDRAVLAVTGACLCVTLNPFGLVSQIVDRSRTLQQVVSTHSILEPAIVAAALAAALAADRVLRGRPTGWTSRLPFVAGSALALVAWSLWRLWLWPSHGSGWASAGAAAAMLALYICGLFAARAGGAVVTVLLCCAVLIDYKVSGTSQVFSSREGHPDRGFVRGMIPAMDPVAADAIRRNRQYRIAVDGMHPTELRRFGLATPQGFDPLLPARYREVIERERPFRTNRLFDLEPGDTRLLDLLGVRYFITYHGGRFPAVLASRPDYKLVGSADPMFHVYERRGAVPPWRIEGAAGTAEPMRWQPERRVFRVEVSAPARFAFVEQFYPGWRATVDGRATAVELWGGAFQSVPLPAGNHTVTFEYRPSSVLWGAAISCGALALLAAAAVRTRGNTGTAANRSA